MMPTGVYEHKPLSEVHKKNIGRGVKEHYKNNPITEEQRKNRSEAAAEYFKNNPMTEERKEKLRKALIKFFQDPKNRERQSKMMEKQWKVLGYRDEWIKTACQAQTKRWSDPKLRKKQSLAVISYYEDPKNRERQSIIMKEVTNRPENKKKQSDINKKKWANPEFREKVIKAIKISKNKPEARETVSRIMTIIMNTPEMKRKISERMTIIMNTPGMKRKISETSKGRVPWIKGLTKETDERVAKQAKNIKEALGRPEVKAKISENSLKNWANPEYQKMMAIARALKPNKLERIFDNLTPNNIRYVGDLSFWIVTKKGTRNPDFKVKDQRKIIELFGDYWHEGENPKDKIKEYTEVGWSCIIFWENEVYNETKRVLKETLEFVKN